MNKLEHTEYYIYFKYTTSKRHKSKEQKKIKIQLCK